MLHSGYLVLLVIFLWFTSCLVVPQITKEGLMLLYIQA